jgi:GT2 family glycosyltransferase
MRQDANEGRPPTGPRYRRLIHQLNQRYRAEFDRAERFRAELAAIHNSRAWKLVCLLRQVKYRLFGPPPAPPPVPAPEPATPLYFHREAPRGRVSLVIPFRDQRRLLRGCLNGLLRTTYQNLEVVLVDNGSTDPQTLRFLKNFRGKLGWEIMRRDEPFNFSRLCNAGAKLATGEFLLFLNNDTETVTPDWLEQLLAVAQHPKVGVVGATLLYPDGTLQHAGLIQQGSTWVHQYRGYPHDYPGDRGELLHVRAVPAVTGACLMIGRALFHQLGGFDERLAVTGNDVDLCRRVRAEGLLVAITPRARLLHFESLSRGYSAEVRAA